MTYRVELAASAKADIRQAVHWLRGQASDAAVVKWLAGLYKTIDTLKARPHRCPIASESEEFPEPIRELLHGRRKGGKYRILFALRGDIAYVLYVRHTARDDLKP